MGTYNDVIIEIRSEKKGMFEEYLRNDDKERRLYPTPNIKHNEGYGSDTYIYQWTGKTQLYVTCGKSDFTIEDEMDRAGLVPEDYIAEMLTENDVYERCGSLQPSYIREMKATVWNGEVYE